MYPLAVEFGSFQRAILVLVNDERCGDICECILGRLFDCQRWSALRFVLDINAVWATEGPALNKTLTRFGSWRFDLGPAGHYDRGCFPDLTSLERIPLPIQMVDAKEKESLMSQAELWAGPMTDLSPKVKTPSPTKEAPPRVVVSPGSAESNSQANKKQRTDVPGPTWTGASSSSDPMQVSAQNDTFVSDSQAQGSSASQGVPLLDFQGMDSQSQPQQQSIPVPPKPREMVIGTAAAEKIARL